MNFRCDLSWLRSGTNPKARGNTDTTYNVVLFTLSGADLLLWKLLAALPLLSVCGLRFPEMTAFSSLTRDLSSWAGLSCCLFGFKSQRRKRVQHSLKSKNLIRCSVFHLTLPHKVFHCCTGIILIRSDYSFSRNVIKLMFLS